MTNSEKISLYYKEAVSGLTEEVLEDNELWYRYVLHLPIRLQIVYTISVLHQQVYNGGFHQYFFNSYGQFAYATLNNLILVKAYTTSELLRNAIQIVNYENWSIEDFRQKIYERQIKKIVEFDRVLGEKLDLLDGKYYYSNENLELLILKYVDS